LGSDSNCGLTTSLTFHTPKGVEVDCVSLGGKRLKNGRPSPGHGPLTRNGGKLGRTREKKKKGKKE